MGHDYIKCVERCRKKYLETHMQAARAGRALDQATELWRQKSCIAGKYHSQELQYSANSREF